jgi:hypothetical protein
VKPEERLSDAYDGLGRALEALKADATLVRAAYETMPRDWLRKTLLVEYRCSNRRGCLLLHVWRGEGQRLFFYVPSYKNSPERNARESVESARQKNTLDGDRIWKPKAGSLEALPEWGSAIGIGLQCDHLLPVTRTPTQLIEDAGRATPGQPTRRVITARFA